MAVIHILLLQTANKIKDEEKEVKHHGVEEEEKVGRSAIYPGEGGDVPPCSLQFFSVAKTLIPIL